MLGSDPIAALLGAGMDPSSPQVVWKGYLRKLVAAGAAVSLMAPDVVVPEGADPAVLAALSALIGRYPPGTQMPGETTGRLAGAGHVDADSERVNLRVSAYYRHVDKVVGKEMAAALFAAGVVTPSAGLHVAGSHMVAVLVPDAAGLTQWRDWASAVSGDPHERHTAPTLLLPSMSGGGVYLFRSSLAESVTDLSLPIGACTVSSGNLVVPIPPTRLAGIPVMRLGPARKLPGWLRTVLLRDGLPTVAAPIAEAV